MHFLAFLLGQVLAASFAKWPAYKGDRDKLDRLVSLFGNMERDLNQDASTLDELVTNEQLMMLALNIRQKDAWKNFGSLLADLSPKRLDAFCEMLQPPLVQVFLAEYPHMDSKWKHQVSLLHGPNGWNCQEVDLKQIVSISCFWNCVGTLPGDQISSAIISSPLLPKFTYIPSNLFEGRPGEYLEVLRHYISSGGEPDSILGTFDEEQYTVLASLLLTINPLRRPQVKDLNVENRYLVDAVNKVGIFMELEGVDANLFEGQSLIPPCVKHQLLQAFRDSQPLQLYHAFKVFYALGNFEMFSKSVILARQATNRVDFLFLEWLREAHIFNDRVVQMFDCVMPAAPQVIHGSYHLIPLYKTILAKPDGSYPEAIIDWAKASMIDVRNHMEDDIAIPNDTNGARSVACWAIYNGWSALFGRVYEQAKLPFFKQALTFLRPLLDDHGLLHYLKPAIASLGITANFNLLELIIDLGLSPDSILSLTENSLLKHRLTLMLHLIPAVKSYDEILGGVNKNSMDFREWVLHRIKGKGMLAVADKKMLHYYFWNRSLRRYYPCNIFSQLGGVDELILGLIPMHMAETPKSRSLELTFTAPPSPASAPAQQQDSLRGSRIY